MIDCGRGSGDGCIVVNGHGAKTAAVRFPSGVRSKVPDIELVGRRPSTKRRGSNITGKTDKAKSATMNVIALCTCKVLPIPDADSVLSCSMVKKFVCFGKKVAYFSSRGTGLEDACSTQSVWVRHDIVDAPVSAVAEVFTQAPCRRRSTIPRCAPKSDLTYLHENPRK